MSVAVETINSFSDDFDRDGLVYPSDVESIVIDTAYHIWQHREKPVPVTSLVASMLRIEPVTGLPRRAYEGEPNSFNGVVGITIDGEEVPRVVLRGITRSQQHVEIRSSRDLKLQILPLEEE